MEPSKRKQVDIDEFFAPAKKKIKSISNPESVDIDTLGDPPANSSPSSNILNLHELLDFSSLEDELAISHRFDVISRVLMHEHHLVVSRDGAETAFEIQEMEFYLQKAHCHEDPFTHGSEEQKVSGRWYFHRAPRRSADASRSLTSLTSYRGGTRKGLDLTIAGPVPLSASPSFSHPARSAATSDKAEQETQHNEAPSGLLRGGILLRSLRGVSTGKASSGNPKSNSVSGPSLLVDKILELSGASTISELVDTIWGGDTNALNLPTRNSSSSRTSYLYLKRITNPATILPTIHKSPRIGIDLSHPGTTIPKPQSTMMDLHPRIRFLPKLYRYYTRPEKLTKGRSQTFYGFIHATLPSYPGIHRSLSENKTFRDILARGIGLKDAVVKKYLVEFEAGKKDGLKHLKHCIGPSGKGAADSPTSYLKLMGALHSILESSSASEQRNEPGTH